MNTNKGRSILLNDSPEDLSAVSSLFSAKLPVVMMEESKTVSGNARGIKPALMYTINSRITLNPNPLPIKSSMYFQKNCIRRMNKDTSRVATKGPKNDFKLNKYSLFNVP